MRQERMRVFVRLRPVPGAEQQAFQVTSSTSLCNTTRSACYTFDQVFDTVESNDGVYEHFQPLVQAAMQGFNTSIVAYGQTASGKTHTMKGIMTAAANDIFESLSASPGRQWYIRASAIEVYNEEVRDMLTDDKHEVKLRGDKQKGTVVDGITEEGVPSAQHLRKLLKRAEYKREVRGTALNSRSSRSHLVVRLYIESKPVEGEVDDAGAITSTTRMAVLDFVDLAGAEQVGKDMSAAADKHRRAEGVYINQSLLALRKVMKSLAEGEGHTAYRDSKLTRILQPSLSGNARTAMICTINPAAAHADLSHRVLQFATEDVKRIVLAPKVNEVAGTEGKMAALQAEIRHLQKALDQAMHTQENTSRNSGPQPLRSTMQLQHRQLTEALDAKERQLHEEAQERQKLEQRLRNLERYVLRGNTSNVKARASWSPALGPSSASKQSTQATPLSPNGPPSISSSWYPGMSAKSPLGSTCKMLGFEAAHFKAAEEARAALRAEVVCKQLVSKGPLTEDAQPSLHNDINQLRQHLTVKQAERVQGEAMEARKQQEIAALEQQIEMLEREQQHTANVSMLLESMQRKTNTVEAPQLSEDTHELEDLLSRLGLAALGGSERSAPHWRQSCEGGSLSTLRIDASAAVDESYAMPNMDSPVQSTTLSTSPAINASMSVLRLFRGAGAESAAAPGQPFAEAPLSTPMPAASIMLPDRTAPDSAGPTPPQASSKEVLQWHKAKVQAATQRVQAELNADIQQLKQVLQERDTAVEKLKFQKQLLVDQVIHLEERVEELTKQNSESNARAQRLAEQLLAARKQLHEYGSGSQQLSGILDARGPASAAAPAAQLPTRPGTADGRLALPPGTSGPAAGPAWGPAAGLSPRSSPGRPSSEHGHIQEPQDKPSSQALFGEVVRLWEEMAVPLYDRSLWYLAYREKDGFFCEAEYRRLMELQKKMTLDTSSNASPGAKKMLGMARRKLEWERKWLVQQLKYMFSEHEREQLFMDWLIHKDFAERKARLVKKLWAYDETAPLDEQQMRKSSELIRILTGMDVEKEANRLTYGRTEGDSWKRTVSNTAGALFKPLLGRVASTSSSAKQAKLRRSNSNGSLRRHSISVFSGWGSKDGAASESNSTQHI